MAEQSGHLLALTEAIGPRPATTDAEKQASEYVESVLAGRGLEVETQEFEAVRGPALAFALYEALLIAIAVGSRWVPWWLGAVLALIVAYLMKRDLDTRGGLSSFLPKAPSRNVIGKHVPKQRRGEKLRVIVISAHCDSPSAALRYGPALGRNVSAVFGMTKLASWLIPLLIVVGAVPFVAGFGLVAWYVTLVPAVLLLLPLALDLQEGLLARPTSGANDDASGIASMLLLMERLVPEGDAQVFETSSLPRIEVRRHTEEDAWAADVVPEESVLTYSPPSSSRRPAFEENDFDDLSWNEEAPGGPSKGQTSMTLGGDEDEAWVAAARRASEQEPEPKPAAERDRKRRLPLLGGRKREEPREEPQANEDVRNWLGVDAGFDAKQEGRKIGSWDNFGGDDEDDDTGWKGGAAGFEDVDDPGFAAEEAARIRRRVTSMPDRSLIEKEIWFVASGAGSVGGQGMRALLDAHGEDLRDALFVNVHAVGAGSLAWVTSEGVGARLPSDRRLTGTSRRVATENDLPIRGKEYHGPVTDATVALARRHKAMSLMGFDINGRQPNVRQLTDTASEIDPAAIEASVDFVAKLIAEL